MSNKKLVTFAVSNNENIMTPEEIEDSQFQKVHFRIYSADRVNDHNYTCSLKVLKKYAKTIAGKPILVWYNKYANGGNGDFTGHEDSSYAKEYPVGFFPKEPKITYEKDENGTIFLCADGYIWTVYYSEIVKVFEDYGGIKGVSSEMLIIDSEMIEDTDIENILQYSFAGLTLLGEHDALGTPIKPAVDGCQGILVTNSSKNDEYEKAKVEFEKILYNSVKQESVETDSFLIQKNKEETMETEIVKNSASPDVVENAVQEVSTKVEVSTDVYSYDDNGNFVGATHEEHEVRTTEVKEVLEEEVEPEMESVENATCKKNACDVQENECKKECNECKTQDNACKSQDNECKVDNECKEAENACKKNNECKTENVCKQDNASTVSLEEFEALKVKYFALETELSESKKAYDTLLLKCNSLEEYKNNKESENMKNAIEIALNSVSHILSSEQIDEWREKSQKCSITNVDEFTNELKAFAFDVQEKNGVVQKDSIRNSIPKEVENEPTDFWERMARKYI